MDINPTYLLAVGSFTLASISLYNLFNSRIQYKRDNSVQLITKMTADQHLTAVFEKFRKLRYSFENDDPSQIGYIALRSHKFEYNGSLHDPSQVVKDLYNFYEVIALGVKNKWLNEKILKTYWGESFILDWLDFQNYVFEMRINYNNKNIFSEYEQLAYKWANRELKKKFIIHR